MTKLRKKIEEVLIGYVVLGDVEKDLWKKKIVPAILRIFQQELEKAIDSVKLEKRITQPMFQDVGRLTEEERKQDLLDCEYNQAVDDLEKLKKELKKQSTKGGSR